MNKGTQPGNQSSPVAEFLSVRQLAREIGVSYHTAISYVNKGVIKSVPMGGRIKISRKEVERFKEFGNREVSKDENDTREQEAVS